MGEHDDDAYVTHDDDAYVTHDDDAYVTHEDVVIALRARIAALEAEQLVRVRPCHDADAVPGEVVVWSDGHEHRFVPTSSYAALEAEKAEAVAMLERCVGDDFRGNEVTSGLFRRGEFVGTGLVPATGGRQLCMKEARQIVLAARELLARLKGGA